MDASRLADAARTQSPTNTHTARNSRLSVEDNAFSKRLAEAPPSFAGGQLQDGGHLSVAATRRSDAFTLSGQGSPFSAGQASGPIGADILRELLPSSQPQGQTLPGMRSELHGLLMLQYNLSRGRTTLMSNILRARHDTAKNSISNLR